MNSSAETIRVLVVEDNPIDLEVVDRALRAAPTQYMVTHCEQLADALDFVPKNQIESFFQSRRISYAIERKRTQQYIEDLAYRTA